MLNHMNISEVSAQVLRVETYLFIFVVERMPRN